MYAIRSYYAVTQTISGTETISYTNNSPDKLDYLWLELAQNLFKEGSRGSFAQRMPVSTEGFRVKSVGFVNGNSEQEANFLISDTSVITSYSIHYTKLYDKEIIRFVKNDRPLENNIREMLEKLGIPDKNPHLFDDVSILAVEMSGYLIKP